uniref:helix-turn-helix transcriptional regulator n=1 Tax=Scandinavium goeteborgense TaxID=1851514 RepID=UPI00135AB8D1|nr:LuxR C-terminal-related transcriptional regulator [Scandinavium goeteborgense]
MQLEQVDLWLSDHYLQLGLQKALENIRFDDTCIRYVFLTEQYYADVLSHNYDLDKNRLILLTNGHDFNFLDSVPLHRLSARATLDDIRNFITSITWQKGEPTMPSHRMLLTAREKKLIDLMKEGKKMTEVGMHMNVHIKTIYQIRQNLIKKMGCTGLIDFLRTLRSDVFSLWMQENQRYPASTRRNVLH